MIMRKFLSFLKESNNGLPTVLMHPKKGIYSVHKDNLFHHVKNKFGDIVHTFFKASDKDVHNTLKKDHGMNLMERVNASRININRGSYNEAMFAKHLNGGKWIDQEHENFAMHHKKILDEALPGESEVQSDRAKAQAASFLEHAKVNGYNGVKSVHLTQKPGDIKRHTGLDISQQENPSDVVVGFHEKPENKSHEFLGASLKSSTSKAIGFHNGGAGVLGKSLGLKLGPLTNDRQRQFIDDNDLDPVTKKAHEQVKGEKGTEEYRNNPLYAEAMKHAASINGEVRDILHQHYENMPQDEVKKHLLSTFVKANESHNLPYVKTHGMGGGISEASAHTEDPSDNEVYHQLRNAQKISFKKGGGSGIHVYADGKRAFGIQVKHNNGPLTSVKVLGQP